MYENTQNLHRYDHPGAVAARDGMVVRALRGLSGALAAGLAVLTIVVVVVSHYAPERGLAGPGSASVFWHVTGGVVAVAAQIVADRSRGLLAFLWSVIVITTVGVVLFAQWWS
ncbi:hypothetical protein [Hoyosella subflava]|uniref:Uncharacterized protein n=1 Tax=Hoyosella subflava (strain DSM 45089 / JCM 17490 / NBRC 109087 / DQS3-9A1) TaxID=443218 RepID=F6EPB5_HOYSD|nr:hypothetical protein [Hoyosella subflava]AEF41775.1 hypothetical protein AS9A_3333 [Hoyosella subflava DQS3-9A1]